VMEEAQNCIKQFHQMSLWLPKCHHYSMIYSAFLFRICFLFIFELDSFYFANPAHSFIRFVSLRRRTFALSVCFSFFVYGCAPVSHISPTHRDIPFVKSDQVLFGTEIFSSYLFLPHLWYEFLF
jgi:hypothetical protein